MRLSLSAGALAAYVGRQVDTFFPDGIAPVSDPALTGHVEAALERLAHCFGAHRVKYYRDAAGPVFDHRHTDQYATFLYYLANTVFRRLGPHPWAEKLYALNKALHGFDAFYEVELPAIMLLMHPVGTVLGRGRYGDFLCVYHNVSVGANLEGESPQLGRGVVLYGGSRILGRTRVGDNALISAGSILIDDVARGDCVTFGRHPDIASKGTRWDVRRDIFRVAADAAP
jgi:serine O-acetyltransferase